MLARPTTEQILLDCCRELMSGVLPALTDEATQVRVVMIESVLRSMAQRAAHETAWMHDEVAAIASYVHDVVAVDPTVSSFDDKPAGLHLDDVVETYCQASRALSSALEAAVRGSHSDLVARGEQLLDNRAGHEKDVMAGWSPTGR